MVSVVVSHRIAETGVTWAASAVFALILVLAISHFANGVTAVRDLMLVRRGRSGEPPEDGLRFAAIGPIVPSGRVLASPLTGMPAVAYSYDISAFGAAAQTSVGHWHGVALAPCAIRTASGPIRLLALPELAFPKSRLTGEGVRARAAAYLRSTSFQRPSGGQSPRDLLTAAKEMLAHYSDSDGSVRVDFGPDEAPGDLQHAAFLEQVVPPGEDVRAIGVYSAAQRALVVDPNAAGHSIRLEKTSGSITASPAARIGRALMNGIVFTAISAAILLAFLTFVPLEGSDPMSFEIDVENHLEQSVRPRIASMELIPFAPPARTLTLYDARGSFRTSSGKTIVTRATAEKRSEGTIIHLFSGDERAGTLVLDRNEQLVGVTLNGSAVQVAQVTSSIRRVDAEWHGRVTWSRGHIVFRAATDP